MFTRESQFSFVDEIRKLFFSLHRVDVAFDDPNFMGCQVIALRSIPRIDPFTLEPCAGVSVRWGNDSPDRFLFHLTLQLVRRVAAVMNAVAMPPFADGLLVCRKNDSPDRFLALQTPEPFRQNRSGLVARPDRGPHLRPSPLPSDQWRTMA